jgi:hypothetical protein
MINIGKDVEGIGLGQNWGTIKHLPEGKEKTKKRFNLTVL